MLTKKPTSNVGLRALVLLVTEAGGYRLVP